MRRKITINGFTHDLDIRDDERLLDVLRDTVGLTGTKDGCRAGECGACTVLVGEQPALACVTLAARVDRPIRTIESDGDDVAVLRRCFADDGGFQCGFCTPGQIMRGAAMLASANREELADSTWVRRQLSGNVCRCTGYAGIVRAIQSAASMVDDPSTGNQADGCDASRPPRAPVPTDAARQPSRGSTRRTHE